MGFFDEGYLEKTPIIFNKLRIRLPGECRLFFQPFE